MRFGSPSHPSTIAPCRKISRRSAADAEAVDARADQADPDARSGPAVTDSSPRPREAAFLETVKVHHLEDRAERVADAARSG
jgi:hypothetical protein